MSSTSQQQTTLAATLALAGAAATAIWMYQHIQYYKNNQIPKSNQQQQQQQQHAPPSRNKLGIPSELQQANHPYSRELQVAVRLALDCGCHMYSYCNEKGTAAEAAHNLDINIKGGKAEDFCTKIDIENEHLVTTELKKQFPTHKIIGEETVGSGPIPPLTNDQPTWIIDPIDGTTNFASGLPLTCVSIGLCVNAEPVLGVVYAPMTNELYMAVKGYGAYRNGVKITTTTTQRNDKKTLKESVVCFEFGYTREKDGIAKMTGAVQKILEHGCRTTRCLGSGVLDLAYVATGRLDVVYAGLAGEGWKPWDYCAGMVIATESGCSIQSFQQPPNKSFDIYSDSVICAGSTALVDELRKVIL